MRHLIFISSLISSSFAYAEFSEIPAEQLTESYIRDTTIIVQKKQPETLLKEDLHLKVKPQSYSLAKQQDMDELPSTNNPSDRLKLVTPDINTPVMTQFIKQRQTMVYDHEAEQREYKLREKYNLASTTDIDLKTLSLPVSYNDTYDLGQNQSYTIQAKSLEIRIPNIQGYKAQSIKTKDGVYDVQVTPSDLIFKFNLK